MTAQAIPASIYSFLRIRQEKVREILACERKQPFSFRRKTYKLSIVTYQNTSRRKIYTKTGDCGETTLLTGPRVAKDELRIALCGDLDELSSVLGIVRAEGLTENDAAAKFEELIFRIQSELLQFGAEIVCVTPLRLKTSTIDHDHIRRLEQEIDEIEISLPPLTQFIIPGRNKISAYLHLARTVCRRAERSLVTLTRKEPDVSLTLLAYLNRLSDLLFVMARWSEPRP